MPPACEHCAFMTSATPSARWRSTSRASCRSRRGWATPTSRRRCATCITRAAPTTPSCSPAFAEGARACHQTFDERQEGRASRARSGVTEQTCNLSRSRSLPLARRLFRLDSSLTSIGRAGCPRSPLRVEARSETSMPRAAAIRRTVPQAGFRPHSMWLSHVGCRSAPWATCSCDRPRASPGLADGLPEGDLRIGSWSHARNGRGRSPSWP